jgi:hypothetical protein
MAGIVVANMKRLVNVYMHLNHNLSQNEVKMTMHHSHDIFQSRQT